jgi:hypothetical protein
MTRQEAIKQAKRLAQKEAPSNDYGDSMYFVIFDPDYKKHIVLNEHTYDIVLGQGEIWESDLKASIWSDGKTTEVEQFYG